MEKGSPAGGSNLLPPDVSIQSRTLCLRAIEAVSLSPFTRFSDVSITSSHLVKRTAVAGFDLVTLGLLAQHGVMGPPRPLDVEVFEVI